MELAGKTALITGSNRGIGKAIAQKLAENGADIIITAPIKSDAESAANEIKERYNVKTYAFELNLLDINSIEDTVKEIEQTTTVDILVNNAGITKDNLFIRMKKEEWEDVIKVNFTSIFYITQPIVKQMIKKRWGRVINISSVVGIMGNAGQTNYSATKAALIGFTKSLAKEVGSRGITVNAVAPGFIDTPMTQGLPEDIKEAYKKQIPLGRFGSPEDVANAVLFLASEKASYITGEVINVNGGML
ncbi:MULTISPECIES: 3-oxoacyl-[acyl-carrier-protein] reductase [unclassified Hydrogenobaculum]|jgi:3-oxoacyl-[acyl-carrier protein] reductase|uniref:3-oxoacyl-[acyl-carrier-protein] reductase n=1 Tax=unclassified Hydrogenobaculum TaxID=2622382 RepID=UPI0001C50D6D|nr:MULTISPECIES: 3-oxoacyl-[acyl-carrier-protein] reductase [unclassified Hydrogenobaculum]AEF18896.1 3-oxoacyl-(acyl-carrier-protein) reductase [Hydrogenobaculum sp. 3684]AEG46184.1 3-oxoacyl-(acyl-carrier-protein) reductase [Hydrogenobaculum sp. SHO]AGG14829.1 3-oxoacyl-(acyl-carrier-protein) reductase [Hydrogenobaculum sp. HO]AGH93124.1 3-oxoacyl-(acyl-carrier-protein) reductase [Hydrogenobaculum sp. SN]